MKKIEGSGSESGSISQRHGSADPDPDPPQNVMDPQHWLSEMLASLASIFFISFILAGSTLQSSTNTLGIHNT